MPAMTISHNTLTNEIQHLIVDELGRGLRLVIINRNQLEADWGIVKSPNGLCQVG